MKYFLIVFYVRRRQKRSFVWGNSPAAAAAAPCRSSENKAVGEMIEPISLFPKVFFTALIICSLGTGKFRVEEPKMFGFQLLLPQR
jgi:hypothetical protein